MILALVETVAPFGIFQVMSAQSYFRAHELPWAGLFIAAVASLAMLSAAAVNLSSVTFLPLQLCLALVVGGMVVGCLGGLVATRLTQS